ncbi:MAG: hypothetical protein NC932_02285, partial [Candidatus Omnitrophica bacterium]|nr:hypothetical protein [Candidatus Omnitrophota bacterium]
IYLAGTFGEMMNSYAPPEYRKMLANIAKLFARNPVSIEPTDNIEVVIRKQKKRMLVHLINYAGLVPRPFEKIMPQYNLKVSITAGQKYCKVYTLADKHGCLVKRYKNGKLEIKVKRIGEYEVIVLEER